MSIIGKGKGRKPIHMQSATLSGYCAVWAAIRELNQFTYQDLSVWMLRNEIEGANDGTIDAYIKRLIKGGYIAVKSRQHYRGKTYRHTYELIKDIGIQAPRLDKHGKPSIQGQGQRNLWRAMKIIKEFTYRELAAAASTQKIIVSPNSAHTYINALAKAGYLIKVKKHKHTGVPATFKFLSSQDTGPLPPQIQRSKAVFDPNLNQVVWSPEDQVEKEQQKIA